MSQETVMKFFEAVGKDEEVARRLHATGENVDDFARLSAEIGRERGFEFDPSDVRTAIESWLATRPAELTDQDLAAVSGGGANYSYYSSSSFFSWASMAYGTPAVPVRPPTPPGGTIV